MFLSPQRTGLVASGGAALSMIIFTFSFIMILFTQDPQIWSDIYDHLNQVAEQEQSYKYLGQTMVLLFSICYVIILFSLLENVSGRNTFPLKLSISFAIPFMVLIGICYFLQISYVRFNLQTEDTDLLASWVMFNPDSVSLSIGMLGWTLMLGISSFFAAFSFGTTRLGRWISIMFFLNAFFCFTGLLAFLIRSTLLVNLSMNLGMGFMITLIPCFLIIYFLRKKEP